MVFSKNNSISRTQAGSPVRDTDRSLAESSFKGRSVEMLLEEHRELSAAVRQTVAHTPTVADVVVTRDAAKNVLLEARFDAALDAIGEERSLRRWLKNKTLTRAQRDGLDTAERLITQAEKDILRTKSRFLEIKNNLGKIPGEVPLLTEADERSLFSSIQPHRAAFWDALYRIPFVRNEAISQLEIVSCGDKRPDYFIFSPRHKERSNEDLLKLVRANVPTIKSILGRVDVVPTKEEEGKLVKLLMEVPLQPTALLKLLTRVREKTHEMVGVHNHLEQRYGRVDAPEAIGAPEHARYLQLFDELGGARTVARRQLEKLEACSEPYRRLKAYIVAANVGLVRKIVNGVEKDIDKRADLDMDGTIGLMLAVEKFDGSVGTRFSTLATWWIRQAVLRLRGTYHHPVALPVHQHARLREIARNQQAGGDALNDEALAAKLGVDSQALSSLKARTVRPVSLNSGVGSEQESDLGSLVADEKVEDVSRPLLRAELAEVVRHVLGRMHEADRTVLELRWGLRGEPMTLEQIAAQRGLTRERIRQIQDRAQKRLAAGPMANLLRQFLD